MNDLLFELVGPYYELAAAEILAALDNDYTSFSRADGLLVVKTDIDAEEIGKRLGLTHRIFDLQFTCHKEEILEKKDEIEVPMGSVGIETRRVKGAKADTKIIKKELGEELAKSNPIDLDDPDNEVMVLVSDMCYVGVVKFKANKAMFRKREVKHRPFFSPVSLEPRYARALINLARAGPGKSMHDPFCGTGGILIEACLMNLNVSGGDIDPEMVNGSRKNLEWLHISCPIREGDFSETIPDDIDCIVTDPPYGRASSTSGEDSEKLYERFLQVSHDRLKSGGHLSTIFPNKRCKKSAQRYFTLVEEHKTRVHSSLDRFFIVLRKD